VGSAELETKIFKIFMSLDTIAFSLKIPGEAFPTYTIFSEISIQKENLNLYCEGQS
jgi:hypothetical protein